MLDIKKQAKRKAQIAMLGLAVKVAFWLSLVLIVVTLVLALVSVVSSESASADCQVVSKENEETSAVNAPADGTIDSFVKEHEAAYILSWKAGGYLPSFSIAQTYVEYGFNFTNPFGTSFWQAHNMGGVKTGASAASFPITLQTYGLDAVDLTGTKPGTNVGDFTGGNYAWFKSYDAGIVGKAEFMAHQTLYTGAINNKDPRAIAKAIAEGGWASDKVAYEKALNDAYDKVGASYKWLDEKAIESYGDSPYVATANVVNVGDATQGSDNATEADNSGGNDCNQRSDGEDAVPDGVKFGTSWKPTELPTVLTEYIIDPKKYGIEYNSEKGWVEKSGECVDLTESLGNVLWGHSGRVIGDGKEQAGAWAKIFGNQTTQTPQKGAIFSSAEEDTYGHTGIVCHVFSDGSILVCEQNYSNSGNAIGVKNTYSYRLINSDTLKKKNFVFAYGNDENLKL